MTIEKKINIPLKGAGKKWAKRLKELGSQKISKEVVKKLNEAYKEKVAMTETEKELEL
jgi:hypothetical protein